MKLRAWLLLVGVVAVAGAACAEDWAQWRGPKRDGISPERDLLKSWPEGGPRLMWAKHDLGSGYSTPAVAQGRLFVQSNEGLDNEYVQALIAGTGKELWKTTLGKVGNPNQAPAYPAARSTPTVDGNRLYALGSDGDLACLETETGKVRWRKSLRADFGGQPGIWAYSESPLIDGNRIICTPGGADATLVALDKATGAVLWKCAVPGGDQAAYASPQVTVIDGVRQYVQFVQRGVVGVEAATGKFLWRYDQTARNSPGNIPTPVIRGDLVYSATGRGGGGLARIKLANGAWEAEQVYFSTKLPNAIGGAVLVNGLLFGTTATGLMCVDFQTGEVKWQERGIGAASLCFAEGLLYLHGENGQVALVEAGPDGYRQKGFIQPPNPPEPGRSKAWAYPIIADKRLYIRELGSLWCYQIGVIK